MPSLFDEVFGGSASGATPRQVSARAVERNNIRVAPGGVPALPSNPLYQNNRCIPIGQVLQRMVCKRYKGLSTAAQAQVAWVLSDTVPNNKYWVVIGASSEFSYDNSTNTPVNFQFGLWIVPPGKLPLVMTGNDPFFQNYSGQSPNALNAPPVEFGVRIDQTTLSQGDTLNINCRPGDEVSIMPTGSRYFIIPPGWTAMVYCNDPAFAYTHIFVELNLAYAEMDISEEFAGVI